MQRIGSRTASWVILVAPAAALLAVSFACQRSRWGGSAKDYNLLLITLDTVRADHLGAYGYRDGQTPNLDRLAGQGVRFANADSPVPLTLPAHASLLSGLLPPHHGVHNNGAESFPATPATLATTLAAAGYRTGAFIGAFVLDHRFGLARGFERYDDEVKRDVAGGVGLEAERPGREVVDRALAWLEDKETRPFFAWVHLYDAHAPYDPPEPFRSRFRAQPYDGEIAEDDAEVGRLLDELDRLGLTGRTVVAVAGDHGEALGEHGEHFHGLLIYEATLHVPLLVRAPQVLAAGWLVETPVSLVDLAPTLAGLLAQRFPAPADHPLDGRDLSPFLLHHREPTAVDFYAESRYATLFDWSPLTALRQGDLKYIAAPRPELYDLRRDPGESDNLLARQEHEGRELATRLAAFAGNRQESSAPAVLDAEARAKLESLGYLAGARLAKPRDGMRLKDPKDMVGLFHAFEDGHQELVLGRLDAAKATFERLVAADSSNPVFVGQFAEVCRRRGDFERAVTLYRQAVALAPDDREARYNLAVTLQEAGRPEEALSAVTAAIALDPGRPEAHNALGIALSLRGDLEGARKQFAKAAELDPRNARVFNNLGNVLRELKQPAEAEQAYRKAIALAPDYADPQNGLGTLEVQRDRPAAAVPHFDRALTLAPSLHEARLNRAIALEMCGDKAAAITAYRDFLRRASGDPQFLAQQQAAQQLLARLERTGPAT